MTPESGSVVANRFQLIRELGRGSMGSVWLAEHLTLDVRCAVKLMAGAALRDPSSRARFQLEAKAIAQLQSPHIVRVLDYDVCDDTPFIAMELLQGEELSTRLRRIGRLDRNATYRVVTEVAAGLSKAHAAGIVHRDLKPDNVFLTQTDDGEVAKLLDFGIAKATAFPIVDTGTLDGTVLGTPQYMSPEQVRGTKDVDHRSDLWSLAVVAYECLLGKMPFESPALGDLFAKILVEPIPVPSRHAPPGVHVPPAFDRWWAKAVSRDPNGRFVSAQAMAEALGKALGAVEDTLDSVTSLEISAQRSFEQQLRGRWRARLLGVAAVAAVAVTAVVVHARHSLGESLGDVVSWADDGHAPPAATAAAAIAPVEAEDTKPAPIPVGALPVASSSSSSAPSVSVKLSTLPSAPSSTTEHALCDPDMNAKSNAAPSWLSRPAPRAEVPVRAPVRAARPAAGATSAAAAKHSADDVDFGI